MSNSSTLPNPNVYLNYLAPDVATAWEVTRNVYLVTCGALIWDMLSSIPADVKIFRRFNMGVLAYGICRPAALAFVLSSVISKVSPLPNCDTMAKGVSSTSLIATGTSSLLFLQRVLAVYADSKIVKYAFFALWLVQIGLSVLIPIGSTEGHLYNTGFCINIGIKKSVIAGAVMPAIFDGLVFVFISYRIATTHANDDDHSHWRTFVSGKALPRLSKALLQSGQQYFLMTVGVNIATMSLAGSPFVSPLYQAILAVPAVALGSVSVCRVYRKLLLEATPTVDESGNTIESSALSFTDITGIRTTSYRTEESSGHTGRSGMQSGNFEVKTLPNDVARTV